MVAAPEPDAAVPFDALYAAAARGEAPLPWDRGGPHPLVEEWVRGLDGAGRRALVVGSGPGADAELLARRGFAVVAFDLSPAALALARRRSPDSPVDYRRADLLRPPAEWTRAFDLVLESLTVQSLPVAHHAAAIARVADMVAPGGTLLVVATARDGAAPVPEGPPWPLTRAEIEAFGAHGLTPVTFEDVREAGVPARWRAEFRRPAS